MNFFLKVLLYFRNQLERINVIDNNVKVPSNALIIGSRITNAVKIGERARIHKASLIGNVRIGSNTSIWGPNTSLYAKINEIKIGNFCSIARNVLMLEYNHNYNLLSTYYINQNVFHENPNSDIYSKGPITIGNDVWIGAQCVILSGVTIGDGAIIAANSVVTSRIPPYAIAGGTPAKVLKYRFDENVIQALLIIQWWNWPIEKIKANKKLFQKEQISIEDLKDHL